MKLTLILACILSIFHSSNAGYKFLRIENCSTSNKNLVEYETCQVSSTAVNFTLNIKKPMENIIAHIGLYRLENSEYRQFFKIPTVKWCELMSGSKKPNTLLKTFLEAAKEICPELIQKCPYRGRYEVFNIKFPKKIIFMFPDGTYRVDLKATDEMTKEFLTFSLFMQTFI